MEIYAKLLADSISESGDRLTTFEVQIPKVLLAEHQTHRMLSRNFQSSRAMPTSKVEEVESFFPLYWGKNQPGMQAQKVEIENPEKANLIWHSAMEHSKVAAKKLTELGLHKQWANRPNDWHVMAKGVVSATEWKNFLWLRYHDAAQPEFMEYARLISEALDSHEPEKLTIGQWHLPYVDTRIDNGVQTFWVDDIEVDVDTALKVSSSCCAQVSYRKLDTSVEKALQVYDKLVGMDRLHASAFEHCGTPIGEIKGFQTWPAGISHRDRDGDFWSGNFKGWIQYRKLLDGENHNF